MKITKVIIDRPRKRLVISIPRKVLECPFAFVSPHDATVSVQIDPDMGGEGIVCQLASGRQQAIHLDDILAFNADDDYLRQNLLYDLTLQAQAALKETGLTRRSLCRLLNTSPPQIYRLLDQTFYGKTLDQMLRLLRVLGRTVTVTVNRAA